MIGKEALVLLTTLSQVMAEKPKEPISHVCGWFNGHIAIVVMSSYFHMTYVAFLSSILQDR